MVFFVVEPEVAGCWPRSAGGAAPVCLFDTWLGDDLVRAHPEFLVTPALRESLVRLDRATGFETTRIEAQASFFFRRHSTGRPLPSFWALRVDGRPGLDDMGLCPDGRLIVSQRVLDCLVRHRVLRATFAQYATGDVPHVRASGA